MTQEPVRTRRTMACFWWQHERETQLRSAGVLAARRTETAENAPPDEHAARPLPAAG